MALFRRTVGQQPLVFDEQDSGLARPDSSSLEQTRAEEEAVIANAAAVERGQAGLIPKRASGGKPWATCRRPWPPMYFTGHGRAQPRCIAPFSARGREACMLGDATQQTLRTTWNRAVMGRGTGAQHGRPA